MTQPQSQNPESPLTPNCRNWKAVPAFYPIMLGPSLSPIKSFDIPEDLKQNHPDLVEELERVRKDFQTIQQNAPKNTEEHCSGLARTLRDIGERQGRILKRAREYNQTDETIDRSKRKRNASIINTLDARNIKTRARFAGSMKLLSDDLLIWSPDQLMLDAFMDGLFASDRVQFPSGSQLKKNVIFAKQPRESSENSDFRELLVNIYSDPKKALEQPDPEIWCSVLGIWMHPQDITAAHIVPQSIGVRDFAYLNGLGDNSDKIYRALFSADNGIMCYRNVEQALDKSQIVIVPTEDDIDGTQYECRVLEQDLIDSSVGGSFSYLDSNGVMQRYRWKDLNGKKLTWLNERRPCATNLYIRYLLTRWCRRRYESKGWEHDRDRIPRKRGWSGTEPLRQGVLSKLAFELGDWITLPGSRSTSGNISVLEEHEDMPVIPECQEEANVDSQVAIRLADSIVNNDKDE